MKHHGGLVKYLEPTMIWQLIKSQFSAPLFSILFIFTFASNSFSGDLYKIYDLEFNGEFWSYHVEDVNNDGLKDIFLFFGQKGKTNLNERWISIYLQNAQGYLKKPTQTFKVPDEIILIDFGDVTGDFKKEFVFFTSQGIYFYKLNNHGYILSPQKLFRTESIFMLSDNKTLQKWDFVADLNGDHLDEVFIPKITKCVVYFRNPKTNDWHENEIPLIAESQVSGIYDKRFSVGNRSEARYATPYIEIIDFNSDNRNDLMGVYKDSLVVFCQDEKGYFSQEYRHKIDLHFGEIWRGAKIQRSHIGEKNERYFLKRIIDLNDDGIIDVVVLHISTRKSFVNPHNEVRIHFGKKDNSNSTERIYFSEEPDQVINPGGTQLVMDILRVNKDNKYDLVLPIVKVSLKNVISMLLTKSVEIQAEIYLMNDDGFYSEKPDVKSKMVVRFSYRGGPTSPVYEIEDFNGDGYLDILSSLEEKMLIIFFGNEENIMDSKVGVKYNIRLPQNGEMVRAINLNTDNKCDVIVTYIEDPEKYKNIANMLRVLIAK